MIPPPCLCKIIGLVQDDIWLHKGCNLHDMCGGLKIMLLYCLHGVGKACIPTSERKMIGSRGREG